MKKLIAITLIFSILSTTVFAATSDSIKSELNKVNQNLKDKQQELKEIQNDKKLTLNDIDNLDKEIDSTETSITNLEKEISQLESDITIATENIAYSEEQYEQKDELRQDRVVAYYKCGSLSFWDTLFEAESITDFFYRYRLMQEIIDYDNQLLSDLKKEKAEIESQKTQLEENKLLCEDKKELAEAKKEALGETKEVRVAYVAKLEKSADLLESSIDEIQKQADNLTEQLKKLASSSTTSKYTGGTMTWPLPNYYSITSKYGMRDHPVLGVRKMHTGVDIAGGGCNGKNVVAAASGKVINAGWISGYGYTVMIDHGGGVVTLYAHSQKLLVKVGQQVKAGEPIMKVGMTGYATGPHLHFEVRVNGKYVDPTNGYISAKK